jgi:hypothetical protein
MNTPNNNQLRDQVLARIKSGSVKMKPRFRFVLRALLLISGLVIAALLVLYLISFVFFMWRANSVWLTPAFGLRGLGIFIMSLPWVLLLFIIFFVLILEILVRHFSFGYRRPLLYSVFGILMVLGLTGFILAQTPLHRGLWESAENEQLPLAGPLYRGLRGDLPDDLHNGIVLTQTEQGFDMQSFEEEILSVQISQQTRLPFGAEFIPGDMVMVIGDLEDGVIKAFGVREINQMMPPPRMKPRFIEDLER